MDMNMLEVLTKFIDFRMFVLIFLVFYPLEHFLPMHKDQNLFREGWITDVTHYFISGIFIRIGMLAIILIAVQIGSNSMPAKISSSVAALPIWLQILAITIIADFGFYIAHRLMHSLPWLWNFHSVHHSSMKMDWLAAYRVHPVDQVIVKGTSLIPIFILGFSDISIGLASLIYFWQSIFIHSNSRVRLGILKWLVATPEFHHWHHANQIEARDKNFSGQLPLWDILFRTAYLPGAMPSTYGVNDPVPKRYLNQLIYPFTCLVHAVTKIYNKAYPSRRS